VWRKCEVVSFAAAFIGKVPGLSTKASCPDCGGELKHLGEDVSEMLEKILEAGES